MIKDWQIALVFSALVALFCGSVVLFFVLMVIFLAENGSLYTRKNRGY